LTAALLLVSGISVIMFVCYLTGFLIIGTTWPTAASGQIENEANRSDSSADSTKGQARTTFSAIGQISSLVITVREPDFNITNAFKVILTGEWNLSVNKGKVTNFSVNLLASPMDGSKPHIHQILNLNTYDDEEPIALSEDENISINGTADIKINGVLIWDNADISISITNGNTFNIDPSDIDTQNHFGDQQVFGIVTRLIY
jgi:hypothetical protein